VVLLTSLKGKFPGHGTNEVQDENHVVLLPGDLGRGATRRTIQQASGKRTTKPERTPRSGGFRQEKVPSRYRKVEEKRPIASMNV